MYDFILFIRQITFCHWAVFLWRKDRRIVKILRRNAVRLILSCGSAISWNPLYHISRKTSKVDFHWAKPNGTSNQTTLSMTHFAVLMNRYHRVHLSWIPSHIIRWLFYSWHIQCRQWERFNGKNIWYHRSQNVQGKKESHIKNYIGWFEYIVIVNEASLFRIKKGTTPLTKHIHGISKTIECNILFGHNIWLYGK